MILFEIIGENLGVIESATVTSATIIGMLIVCWAIYTVYTGEFCNLQEKKKMGFYIALLYAGYGAETVVPLFVIGFVIWGWSGLASDILEGDFQYFT